MYISEIHSNAVILITILNLQLKCCILSFANNLHKINLIKLHKITYTYIKLI